MLYYSHNRKSHFCLVERTELQGLVSVRTELQGQGLVSVDDDWVLSKRDLSARTEDVFSTPWTALGSGAFHRFWPRLNSSRGFIQCSEDAWNFRRLTVNPSKNTALLPSTAPSQGGACAFCVQQEPLFPCFPVP